MRMRTPASLGGLVVATGVVLALATGCSGDDPEPRIAPTESVASTPSSSAPTGSPTDEHSRSAIETVEEWVRAQNEGLLTGDTTRMHELSAKHCRGCDNFTEPIERVYADGGSYDTDGWRLVKATARSLQATPVVVDAGISIAGGETILKAGNDPVVYDEEKHTMVFKLVRDDGDWSISFIGFLS